jgi:hypothetical protein
MNKKTLLFALLIISAGLMSFQLSKNIQKKVDKEIKSTFEVNEFELNSILIPQHINDAFKMNIRKGFFFKVTANNGPLGYCFVGKAPSKTDNFDYLVLFDNDQIIKKIKVLVYREDYGAEIGSKRWLKQFIGIEKTDRINYFQDIIAISGATISARSLTVEVNNLLKSIEILDQNKLLN